MEEYSNVFAEPRGLPPHKERDQCIHLEPNAKPENVRPYRYPQYQKNEIEKIVKELLTQGTIKVSTSSDSSPSLLVKMKD